MSKIIVNHTIHRCARFCFTGLYTVSTLLNNVLMVLGDFSRKGGRFGWCPGDCGDLNFIPVGTHKVSVRDIFWEWEVWVGVGTVWTHLNNVLCVSRCMRRFIPAVDCTHSSPPRERGTPNVREAARRKINDACCLPVSVQRSHSAR